MCGGLASDPQAVPLLIGLGVDELSVVPAVDPAAQGACSRALTLDDCRALARARAGAADDAAAVRALLRAVRRGDAMKDLLAGLQQLGGALMLPIAVLPIAGLLLRLGQPDLLDIGRRWPRPATRSSPTSACCSRSAWRWAWRARTTARRGSPASSATGRDQGRRGADRGAADALADLTGQARDLAAAAYKAHELAKLSVPVGILSGLIGGALYNRFSDISLPSYLAFFGGRRFVPIVSRLRGPGARRWRSALGWQRLEHGMDALSRAVLHAGAFGLFAYGVLNRVLIVTGLHHILNNIAWFMLGDYHGVTGDLKRFFAGDPTAGRLHVGLLPGDDVRPAGGVPRHVPHRAAGAAHARSAACWARSRSPRSSPASPSRSSSPSCSSRRCCTPCTRC